MVAGAMAGRLTNTALDIIPTNMPGRFLTGEIAGSSARDIISDNDMPALDNSVVALVK